MGSARLIFDLEERRYTGIGGFYMEIHSVPITRANREQALALEILPEQRGYIETVEQCLAEADRCRRWRAVGLLDGGSMIGFAMYGFFFWESFPRGRLWLDRFLIDCRYQGQGYGSGALAYLLALLAEKYPKKDVYLSVIRGNERAARLYQKFGFRFTGERDIHGEDVMRREAGWENL